MSAQGFTDTGIVLGGNNTASSGAAGPYDQLIEKSARDQGIDPVQFRRQMYTENPKMDPLAVSPAGAVGIPQLMPAVSQAYGVDATIPEQSIPVAAIEMRKHSERYGGDQVQALTAYNWGSGNLQKYGLANAPAESRAYYTSITGKPFPGATAQQQTAMPAPANDTGTTTYQNADGSIVTSPAPWDNNPSQGQAPSPAEGFTDTGIVLGQGQDQQPPPSAPDQGFTDTGVVLDPLTRPEPATPWRRADPATPWHPDLPWYSVKEVPGALKQGLTDAAHEAMQTATGKGFTDQKTQAQPPQSFLGEAAYGMAHSAPTLATGLAGSAAGTAVEPGLGTVAGGAAGFGAGAAFQALAPGYAAGRQQGMTHDQAVDYAIKRAATEGVIGAATAPLFGMAPFKNAVGKALFTAFATMPAVGGATRVVEPLITGDKQPTGKELARGVGQDIVTGGAFGLGHHILTHVTTPKPAAPRIEPTAAAVPTAAAPVEPGRVEPTAVPVPSPPAQGVPPHEPIPPAAHAAAAPEAPIPGAGPAPDVQPGGQQAASGDTGDQAGLVRPVEVPGPGIPPETARPGGDVPVGGPGGEAPAGPQFLGPSITRETPEGGPGTSRVLKTQSGDVSVPTRYEVVDASQLKPAEGDLQPRDRAGRAASDQQIAANAARLDPEQLMAGHTADYGAPVVTKDGTVLAGNGRLASIQRAAELHPEKYAAYVEALKAAGHDIPPDMKTPVLVRRAGDMTPEAMATFARDSNVSRAMAMSPVEQAKQDAKTLTPEMVSRYAPNNQQFVRDWVGSLPKSEQNRVIDANGQLSQEGQRRLNGALLAKAYGHEDVLNRALESPNDDTRGITNSLADAAPQWAALRAKIDTGQLPKEFDITKNLTQALDMVRQQRESHLTPSDMVNQLDLERGKLEPITEELYRSFYNDKMDRLRSRTKLTAVIKDYLQHAEQFRSGKDLLGEEAKPDPAQLIRLAREGDKGFLDTTDQTSEQPPGEMHDEALGQEQVLSPKDQALLDQAEGQISKLQKSGANPAQLEVRIKARDELLAKKKIPSPAKRVSLEPPRAESVKPEFLDYKIQKDEPIYRDAFVEHAENKLGMSREDAVKFARDIVHKPITRQVEILRSQVQDKFQFPDVTLDDRLKPFDARNTLLDLHRAMTDMMHSMGIPAEMASLMGKVKLELHPLTKRSPAFGTYFPGEKIIRVYGRASVFGHEWVHALDHDMTDTMFKIQNPGILATTLGRHGSLSPNDPMTSRMGNLLNTMFHDKAGLALKRIDLELKAQETGKTGLPTPRARKAQAELTAMEGGTKVKGQKIDPSQFHEGAKEMGGGYWTTEYEMLARAGEAYLARVMEQQGLDPRGVVMKDEAYQSNNDKRLRASFPKLQERADIFQAFDHLMDGYRQTALSGSVAASQALRDGIADPRVFGKMTQNPKQVGAFTELVHRVRNRNETWARTALTDPNRPDPGKRNAWKRTRAWASQVFNTKMGAMEAILEDHNTSAAAKPALQKVMDRLGRTVGSGRATGWEPIEERRKNLADEAIKQYANILHNVGLDPEMMTKQQRDHLRHAMTTGETTYPLNSLEPNGPSEPIDPRVNQAASFLRPVSNRFYKMMDDLGFNIGYASGHFQRFYDVARADADPDGFIRQASSVHKDMFNEEVGTPGDHPDKLLENWNRLVTDNKKSADPATQDGMRQLAKTLNKQRALEQDILSNGHTPAKDAELDQLQTEAEQLATDHHDGVGDHIANLNAENWLHRMRTNYVGDWDKNGPGGSFLNKRTLPPQADQKMRDFMETDPGAVLPRFYESAASKIAYAERFGANDEMRKQLVDDMIRGGMHRDDVRFINESIDHLSGRTRNSNNRNVTVAANIIHAYTAATMLDRAIWSMTAEPFVSALHTGSLRVGLKSMLAQFGEVMRTEDAKGRAQFADLIGVTRSATLDDVLANRVGADYSDSPLIGKAMSWFYRMSWQTQVTNAARRSVTVGTDWYLSHLSENFLDKTDTARASYKRDVARRWFNELGVPEEDHEDFAKWKAPQDGRPDLDAPEHQRFGSTYARAMRRLNRGSVIDPDKAERSSLGDDKWMSLILQFTNYNMGFQRQVLDPQIRRWGHAYQHRFEYSQAQGQNKMVSMMRGGGNTAWAIGHTAAIASAYVGLNILPTALRQYLFNYDEWKKHEDAGDLEDYILDLAVSRSSLSGSIDPIIQLGTHLRYDQDISSLLSGAGLKYIGKNAWSVFSMFANPSGDKSGSNLRAHEGIKGAYNLIGVPLSALIATRLSGFGSLATFGAGGLNQYLTSPEFADKFADFFVGKKGTTLNQPTGGPPEPPEPPQPPEPPEPPEPGQAPPKGPSTEGISDVQGASAVPWGILDDFIAPAWRVAKPVLGMIPGPIKGLTAAAAAAYYGVNFWNKYEPYRDAPPPIPKEKTP